MRKEVRTICYDEELRLEAYRLEGIVQPFPNHFHEYYVIGLVEQGKRSLSCKNRTYTLSRGDLVLFNPGDNHSCAQYGTEPLDYRAFNITQETMAGLMREIAGTPELPRFHKTVVQDEELACYLRPLHQMIMEGSREFDREENLFLMISVLAEKYSGPCGSRVPECMAEVESACAFLREHYAQPLGLEEICRHAGLSKSTLLRAFTREVGVTPYRYLQTVRIGEAKKLLEQGTSPLEAAIQTGFSDQSHFTNFFKMFIGLAPGAYRDIFEERNHGEAGQDAKDR